MTRPVVKFVLFAGCFLLVPKSGAQYFNPYANPYAVAPYAGAGGYKAGQAQLVDAAGQLAVSNQEARVVQQQAYQAQIRSCPANIAAPDRPAIRRGATHGRLDRQPSRVFAAAIVQFGLSV